MNAFLLLQSECERKIRVKEKSVKSELYCSDDEDDEEYEDYNDYTDWWVDDGTDDTTDGGIPGYN